MFMSKLIILLLFPYIYQAQTVIPPRIQEIADSIVETKKYCPNVNIANESVYFYPDNTSTKDTSNLGRYQFKYNIELESNLEIEFYIQIYSNYTIQTLGGFLDNEQSYSMCNLLTRRELWKIARNNGLHKRYKRSKYKVYFSDENYYIRFYIPHTRWDANWIIINATTGEFIKHIKMNVTF